jgi:hypothetical protein
MPPAQEGYDQVVIQPVLPKTRSQFTTSLYAWRHPTDSEVPMPPRGEADRAESE